jgi:hypothetical protein
VKRCLEVGTRRIAHFNVTVNPTATWTLQQFREVMMDAPSYETCTLPIYLMNSAPNLGCPWSTHQA